MKGLKSCMCICKKTDYLIVETTDGDARVDVRARRQCPEADVGGCTEPDPPGGHAEHDRQTDAGHG